MSVRSYEDRLTGGLVHIGSQTDHEYMQSVVYIACQGEDTILAWEQSWKDTVPTCLRCIAAGPR